MKPQRYKVWHKKQKRWMGELAILSQIGEVILLSPKTDGLEMEYITDDVYIMQYFFCSRT